MRHIYFFLFSLFPYTILAKDPYPKNPNIDILTKYKRYIASKPWVCNNYLRIPERKPEWL